MFDLKNVINGKVISLHKEIRHVKRSKSSYDDFSTKHTPSATLKKYASLGERLRSLLFRLYGRGRVYCI